MLQKLQTRWQLTLMRLDLSESTGTRQKIKTRTITGAYCKIFFRVTASVFNRQRERCEIYRVKERKTKQKKKKMDRATSCKMKCNSCNTVISWIAQIKSWWFCSEKLQRLRQTETQRERKRERTTERTESASRNANLLSDNIKIKFSSQKANRGQRRGGEEGEHSVWAAA